MTGSNKFDSCPKIDAHNHLNLGMRYSTYTQWAGFLIPDFPRTLNGLDEMHKIIAEYTRPRCRTAQDIEQLIDMSIRDAIADSVKVLEGSIDCSFVDMYDSTDKFIEMAASKAAEYAGSIDFRPEFGMGKTFDIEKIRKWAPACIESGVFKSIDLYGPEVEEGIENFSDFFVLAGKMGVKKKAHVGEFSNAQSVRRFVEYFELEEVQHGIGAAKDPQVMRFLADNNIRLNVCPASNVMLGAVPSLKEHPIRALLDAGIEVTVGTDDLLLFDRSVGEQFCDLISAGVLSEAEAAVVMNTGL